MSAAGHTFVDHLTGVREILAAEEYRRAFPASVVAICGACHRRWDDAIASSWTPAPAGRCPFEYEH